MNIEIENKCNATFKLFQLSQFQKYKSEMINNIEAAKSTSINVDSTESLCRHLAFQYSPCILCIIFSAYITIFHCYHYGI